MSHLTTHAFYVQDTFTRNRLTINLGFRLDVQDDEAVAGEVPANPLFPTLMPAVNFQGADAGVTWNDFSPRLGFTYDLTGNGRNVLSSSYATYYGQMGPGQLSSQLAATGAVFVRYPWTDTNGDGFVQPAEVNTSVHVPEQERAPTTRPTRPAPRRRRASIPNVKNDRTREFIVGFDRQLGAQHGASAAATSGASTISSSGTTATTSPAPTTSPVNYQPTTCPAGARCEAVTYYQPTIADPVAEHLHQPARIAIATSTASS